MPTARAESVTKALEKAFGVKRSDPYFKEVLGASPSALLSKGGKKRSKRAQA